jgi:DNA-binding transcriptional regulator YhcF (GntR family)
MGSMREIILHPDSGVPIYREIVDQISLAVSLGELGAGFRLPTVRRLAEETGIAQGTIKHAYDMLERLGIIDKARGSGTFVKIPDKNDIKTSTRDSAMKVCNEFLSKMDDLSISPREAKIYLDLKIRERSGQESHVTIAAVDCSPEALSVMKEQILGIAHTEVLSFDLDEVLEQEGIFDPGTDIVVTTATHFNDLSQKMSRRPNRLVMSLATKTALDIAALPQNTKLGLVCASQRFSRLVREACEKYTKLNPPLAIAFFGSKPEIESLLASVDRLILPPRYGRFASKYEEHLLQKAQESLCPIEYLYQVERGSLLFLEEQVQRVWNSRH